jgi:hypothetical protein
LTDLEAFYMDSCIENFAILHESSYLTPEQNPSCETNSCSTCQEIPSFLWNLRVDYRVHKSPPRVPTPIHINPVHILFPYDPFRIILPSASSSSKWFRPFRFFDSNYELYIFYIFHSCYMLHHHILLDMTALIIFGEECRLLLNPLCNFIYPSVI